MKTRSYLIATTLLFAIATFGQVPNALAQAQAFFSGSYAGSGQGYEWFTPSGGQASKADVSDTVRVLFNGFTFFGTITTVAASTFSAAPAIVCTGLIDGTYQLNYDGTGTDSESITYLSGPCPNATGTESFVIDSHGRVIHSTATSAAVDPSAGTVNSLVLTSTLVKQN